MKNRVMSMWPFSTARCKGVLLFFVVRVGMRSFIGLYFSISSVRNLTMLRWPLSQLMCNGVTPSSSWHRGSTCCSVIRYLITSRWACAVATWSGVLPRWPGHVGLQFFSHTKYLSTSKLSPCAAAWRAVSPYLSFWSGFLCSFVRNLTRSRSPIEAA